MRRVVVTGAGLITPLGSSVQLAWKGIVEGQSGIKRIPETKFAVSDLSSKVAAYIASTKEDALLGFDPELCGSGSNVKKMDRFIHLGIAGAGSALRDAGWSSDMPLCPPSRIGVIVGSGIGGLICIEANACALHERGARRISPFFVPASLVNLVAGQISMEYGLKGPNFSIVTACATGAHAIGEAAHIIRRNDADVMVCGGAEAAICRLGIGGFAAAKALSTKYNDSPERASRPWDKERDGFVMGEGAGILVLEELEHAKKRGVHIYGELIGYGLSSDAYHITAPDPQGEGAYSAMQMALAQAHLNIDEIEYINAHGTSTLPGDIAEYKAVRRLFSNHPLLYMSSTKSAIGHLLGAAGSVEAIFSLLALRDSILPPTLNLDDPDEECSAKNINLIPYTAIEKKLSIVMTNSFGFGGTNASLIFQKL